MNVKKLKRTFKSVGHAYKSVDMYGEAVGLNFKNEDTINSHAGSTVSLALMTCLIAYTSYRFGLMVTYENSSVTTDFIPNYFS